MDIQELWFQYGFWLVIAVSIANLVLVIYCFRKKHERIFCYVVARHVVLAWKLVFRSLLVILTLGMILAMQKKSHEGTGNGGRETEQLAGFVNRVTLPVQWVVDGLIEFLGIIAILICAAIIALTDSIGEHPLPYLIGAICLYLLWLGGTLLDTTENAALNAMTDAERLDARRGPCGEVAPGTTLWSSHREALEHMRDTFCQSVPADQRQIRDLRCHDLGFYPASKWNPRYLGGVWHTIPQVGARTSLDGDGNDWTYDFHLPDGHNSMDETPEETARIWKNATVVDAASGEPVWYCGTEVVLTLARQGLIRRLKNSERFRLKDDFDREWEARHPEQASISSVIYWEPAKGLKEEFFRITQKGLDALKLPRTDGLPKRTPTMWGEAIAGTVAGLVACVLLALTSVFALAVTVQGITSYIDAH